MPGACGTASVVASTLPRSLTGVRQSLRQALFGRGLVTRTRSRIAMRIFPDGATSRLSVLLVAERLIFEFDFLNPQDDAVPLCDLSRMAPPLRTRHWTLIGFGGVGRVAENFGDLGSADNHAAIGAGFRYLVARQYGMRMGVDVGYGDDGDWSVYVTMDTGWVRP